MTFKTPENPLFPRIKGALYKQLKTIQEDNRQSRDIGPNGIKAYTPVRLQVYYDMTWRLHSGDPDLDRDLRGTWAYGGVWADMNSFERRALARNLITDARNY